MRSISAACLLFAGLVVAKDEGGRYTVTANGKVYDGTDFRATDLPCQGTLTVRGTNNGFDIKCANLNLYNYAFTGGVAEGRMFDTPTTIFTSREMELTAAEIGTPKINQMRLKDGTLVLEFATASGAVKYQARDKPQGGVLQMETEFGFNVTHVVTLAPSTFYFLNPNMNNAVRIGNGLPATSTHEAYVGKDSPQAANRLYQDGSVSKWNVWSGGRMGAVFGEDALEDAPPATTCTSDCQAQNQVKGSLPVSELPDTIVPIGAGDD